MAKALTPKQEETLVTLHGMITHNGYAPSIRELATTLNISHCNALGGRLQSLHTKGYIDRGPKGQARTWTLTAKGLAAVAKGGQPCG